MIFVLDSSLHLLFLVYSKIDISTVAVVFSEVLVLILFDIQAYRGIVTFVQRSKKKTKILYKISKEIFITFLFCYYALNLIVILATKKMRRIFIA